MASRPARSLGIDNVRGVKCDFSQHPYFLVEPKSGYASNVANHAREDRVRDLRLNFNTPIDFGGSTCLRKWRRRHQHLSKLCTADREACGGCRLRRTAVAISSAAFENVPAIFLDGQWPWRRPAAKISAIKCSAGSVSLLLWAAPSIFPKPPPGRRRPI